MARRDHFQQSQLKRYRTRGYRNPHLDGRVGTPWKLVGLVVAGCLALTALATFLFSGSLFRLSRVEVVGVESIDRQQLEEVIQTYGQTRKGFFFKNINRFLFSSEEVSHQLEETFALASISVAVQEDTIYIHLEERTANFFWRTGHRLYVTDLEGIIVREVSNDQDEILQRSDLSELPIFIDVNAVDVHVGSQVLTQEEVEQAFAFFEKLKGSGIGTTYTEIDRLAGKWVKTMTTQGYSILFDLTGEINKQFDHLTVVLQEQAGGGQIREYIDLRFGDKIYYK